MLPNLFLEDDFGIDRIGEDSATFEAIFSLRMTPFP
jgi:hypothetical protein